MKLVDLNDDCLDEIWKYLDFNDRINLQFASDRFSNLTAAYLEREEFQFGNFKEEISFAQAKSLLSQFGFCIKRLSYNYSSCGYWRNKFNRYKILLLKYCPNIEELDIGHKSGTYKTDTELLIAFKDKLKVLKAACCDLTDKDCLIISKLTRLEFLDLHMTTVTTGEFLLNFRKLKYLNIASCWEFQSEIFNKLCHNNRFESLDIQECPFLNEQSFEILLQTQSDCLRQLNVSHFYHKAYVTDLMKLKSLRIIRIDWIQGVRNGQNAVIAELARLHGDDLESLELFLETNYEISDKDLTNILKFKNLKKLHLHRHGEPLELLHKLVKLFPNVDLAVNWKKL